MVPKLTLTKLSDSVSFPSIYHKLIGIKITLVVNAAHTTDDTDADIKQKKQLVDRQNNR